ncbi:helicase HerA-like C-terminal domain-containing protein [Ralstonia sp. SET104]|uniref:helicase HerA-like C-terminal domain-containing protein n=1 Tax=Ralstonia sp. SET104 TaxID=2448774 RepID=UPI000F58C0B9|nr:helicase HerA-like C-terminal domain-containing protein [Ralstonia sp. SET104]
MTDPILIAKNAKAELVLLPQLANRHGLITGATGTGKTVTLQTIAQGLSKIGVPVFLADVKGDLTGISQPGQSNDKLKTRLQERGLEEPQWAGCPVTLWDVYGERGHPVRATVSDMGPLMLSRMLELNDIQTGVLNLVFKIADDAGLALLDMKDLRAMLQHVGEHASDYTNKYGNISSASIGAIQRNLIALEEQGADQFFGEPMLDVNDLMQTVRGQGVINILAADKLLNAPKLYATFLLWMLSELFEHLPEVGDLDKPKLAFFFDEAHLLFNDAPPSLLQKVEQVVRLIRSKGVGVYFVTQNPSDVPDTVLGQLGNRVQHALRAFTPRDQKAVKAAATTMRANPEFSIEAAIGELAVGEALISMLDESGRPEITQRAFVVPPASRIGPISDDERRALISNSLVAGRYDTAIDRESAYEILTGRVAGGGAAAAPAPGSIGTDFGASPGAAPAPAPAQVPAQEGGWLGEVGSILTKGTGRTGRGDSIVETLAKSTMRTIGSTVGREIVRGVLGSILGGGKRR